MAKFELEPYHHNIAEKDLIDDIIRVARLLRKNSITNYEYREYGNYGLKRLDGDLVHGLMQLKRRS